MQETHGLQREKRVIATAAVGLVAVQGGQKENVGEEKVRH
jgi:hypothetical protein